MSIDHNRIKVADLEQNQPNKILTTDQNGELEFTDINDIKIDSYNALDYVTVGKALDARQGKILKDLIDNINTLLASDNVNLNTLQELVDAIETIQNSLNTILVNDLTSGGSTKALTAEMGKLLQNNKVDKVAGKNLLSDTEITRLGTLSNYTHPTNHSPGVITQDTNNRFVTDAEKANWNAKQSLFTGVTNFIAKSLNATTLISSRLLDNGTYFGIGTSKTPTKDITLGNQSNREIGIEQSSNIEQGKDLVVTAGRTINYLENTNFISLNQTVSNWAGMASDSNGNIYAGKTYAGGGIFMQTAGTGNFIQIFAFDNLITGVAVSPNGNIYFTFKVGNIYMKPNGSGNFNSLNQTTRSWTGIAAASNGNVYACADNGDIYMQTNGIGNFNPLNQAIRRWSSITVAPNGNVYAGINGGDIYMQTNGSGNFNPLNQITKTWNCLAAAPNGNVYACATAGDIYMQTNGIGNFLPLGQTPSYWSGITASPNGNIYASVDIAFGFPQGIYIQLNNAVGNDNLKGGVLKLKSGTGKGIGQSRIEFVTGQKTVSGTNMQIETLREYIDENGYHIHISMPTYPDNTAAITGGLPIGCEYKTATGQRMIVY